MLQMFFVECLGILALEQWDFQKKTSLVNLFLTGGLFELAQHYDIFSGTADWNDILAYGVGGLAAYGIDKAIEKKANKKNLEKEILDSN